MNIALASWRPFDSIEVDLLKFDFCRLVHKNDYIRVSVKKTAYLVLFSNIMFYIYIFCKTRELLVINWSRIELSKSAFTPFRGIRFKFHSH